MYPNGQQQPAPLSGDSPNDGGIFHVQPPKKNKKKTIIIVGIVSIGVLSVILAAVLFVILIVLAPVPEVKKEESANLKSSAFVQKIRDSLEQEYPEDIVKEGEISAKPVLVLGDSAPAPAYKPDGYQYYTLYDSEAAFTYELKLPSAPMTEVEVATKEEPRAVSDIVSDMYKESELAVLSRDTSEENGAKVTLAHMYTGRGIVCLISAENTPLLQKGTVTCGDSKKYTETAATIQPFADALTGLSPETTLKYLTIEESDAGGHQKALLRVVSEKGEESTSYFYKKGSGRWLFFTNSVEDRLSCGLFNSLDIQRAYVNTPCVDAANPTATVKIIEKR